MSACLFEVQDFGNLWTDWALIFREYCYWPAVVFSYFLYPIPSYWMNEQANKEAKCLSDGQTYKYIFMTYVNYFIAKGYA